MVEMSMRLCWWVRKLRRYLPWLVVLLVCYIIYQAFRESLLHTSQPRVVVSTTPHPQVPTKPSPPNQWLVVEISDHPEVCTRLAMAFPEWMILLAGVKPQAKYIHSRCVYMTAIDAEDFAQSQYLQASTATFQSSLPIYYLYAVKQGADLIYIPSKTAKPQDLEMPPIVYSYENYQGLTYTSSQGAYFDTNVHFGCNVSSVHRRLDQSRQYQICSIPKVPVLQSAAIVGPLQTVVVQEIDISLQQETIVYCDDTAPSVTLNPGTFTPLQLHDATFLRDAFWALPVFSSPTAEFHETWALIVQTLLWRTGSGEEANRILVYPHGIHDLIAAGYSERTAKLRQHLSQATCSYTSFQVCATELVGDLVNKAFLDKEILEIWNSWLNALKQVGYTFPMVVGSISDLQECGKEVVVYYPIDYSVTLSTKEYRRKPYVPVANEALNTKLFHSLCDDIKSGSAFNINLDLARPWQQYSEVLLVVVFNKEHYESVPYVETLYRSFFPNILYCGPSNPDMDKFPALKGLNISFVSYGGTPKGHFPGAFNYKCVTFAVDMHYSLQGYLVIADDILVPTHPLVKKMEEFRQVIWFLPKMEMRVGDIMKLRECRLGMCQLYPHWRWWEDYRPQLLQLFYTFNNLQKTSPTVHQCYTQLKHLNGADMRPSGGYSDVYYIPNRLASDFSALAKIFLQHEVFLEIAVPTIIRCLELPEDIQELEGKQLWELDRTSPWIYFTPKDLVGKNYIHPTKWSNISHGDPEPTDFYCNKVMPFMHDPYARYTKS